MSDFESYKTQLGLT